MPFYFIDTAGGYYETLTDIATPAGHQAVAKKPSGDHTWSGSAWTAPDISTLRNRKLAQLAERRWQAEYGGATIAGVAVDTSDKTRAVLKSEHDFAVSNSSHTIPSFKRGPGDFVTLTASEIIALALGVRAHVQACFAREEVLSDQIMAAGNAAALDAIDIEAGWP